MSKNTHDDSLMAQVLKGQLGRRDFLRRAGTLAAAPTLLKAGAIGGAAAIAAPAISSYAQDDATLLTVNNEQQATWIRNFNPLLSENVSCRWPTHFGIYEPLFVWNTIKSEAVPWLAEAWEWSEDNLSLTFTLRKASPGPMARRSPPRTLPSPGTSSRKSKDSRATAHEPRFRA